MRFDASNYELCAHAIYALDGSCVALRLPRKEFVLEARDYVLSPSVGIGRFGALLTNTAQPVWMNDYTKQDNTDWLIERWLTGMWTRPDTGETGPRVAHNLYRINPAALDRLLMALLARVHLPSRTESYEQACCNGSSVVPDELQPCGVFAKDPAADMHDLMFDLNHAGAVDSFGWKPELHQCNVDYRDVFTAAERPKTGAVWFVGLELPVVGAVRLWNASRSRHGLSSKQTQERAT